MNKRDVELLYEIGTLRNFQRDWHRVLGMNSASVTEHIFRVAFIALIIARSENFKDEEIIIKMALIHDVPEIRTGETGYIQAVYVKNDESRAMKDALDKTILTDFEKVLREYNERKTLASKIVKDADNLDVDLEIQELKEQGSSFFGKSRHLRRIVRNKKLYTKSAKKLWDMIQKSDPDDWHLKANKWVKMPKAGR